MESETRLHLIVGVHPNQVSSGRKAKTKKCMKKYLILLLALIGADAINAQVWGEIHGKVKGSDIGTLVSANVQASAGDKQIGVSTDLDGEFKLKPLNAGTYNITISFIGYHKATIEGVVVKPDQVTFLKDIVLEPLTIALGDGAEVIVFKEPLINPEETSRMTTLKADLDHSPARRDIKNVITAMSPGVTIDPATQELHFKGTRTDAIQYIVDGVKLMGSYTALPASGVGSVSVYTGGVPAKYGDLTGGVVIIESVSYFDLYNDWINKNR